MGPMDTASRLVIGRYVIIMVEDNVIIRNSFLNNFHFSVWNDCSSGGGSWWQGDPTRSSSPASSSLPSPPSASSTSGQSCPFFHPSAFLTKGRVCKRAKVWEVRIQRSAEFKWFARCGVSSLISLSVGSLYHSNNTHSQLWFAQLLISLSLNHSDYTTTREHCSLCCDWLPWHKFVCRVHQISLGVPSFASDYD